MLCGIAVGKSKRHRSHRRQRIIPIKIIRSYGNGHFNIEQQLPELLKFLQKENLKAKIGQNGVHNLFGLEHINALDVGISPYSTKGQRLIQFLRSNFIPFLAISGRKRGVSTGPHVHIGFASPRTHVRHPVGFTDGHFNGMICPFYREGIICF